MDPLTAVSLAGTVIQFVDFTAKLVSSGTQLYKSSELQSNIIAGEAADHIQMLASSALSEIQDYQFKLRQGNISTSQDLSRDERLLQDLCRKCTAEADTLTDLLNKLKVPQTTQHRKWRSLGQALSGIWSKKEIDRLMHNLQEYRTQVNSQLLVSLGSRLDLMAIQASDKFQSLAFDNKTIISALLNLQATVSGEFQVQLRTLSVLLNRTESVIADQEDHTRKVIVDVLQQVLDFDEDVVQPTPAQKKGQKERAIRTEVSDEILDSLRFPSMEERFEGVAEAHRKTFEWIFQKPRDASGGEPQRQWSDFNHWLQYGDGLYWINGKPASGKSTLMKFIITHPTTAKSLALWIADSPQSVPLYTASFFFWASGTLLQKSQAGLLRSVLHGVLRQNTNLIPVVFPRQWSARYLEKLSPSPSRRLQKDTWLLSGLKLAFKTLVYQSQIPLKMCLFIDGLDEYDGLDENEIAKLFQEVSDSPNVKLCVSSRPHQVFQDAFATRPSLRVQDLSASDIKQFVQDELGDDARMRQLSKSEPYEAPKLVKEIVTTASGVFLWVRLAVASLLRGLGGHDTVSDLQARLRILPRDLEELYSHIILKVDETYRAEASRLLTLIHEATTHRPDVDLVLPVSPLTILAASFAEDADFDLIYSKPTEFLTWEKLAHRCERMASRIGSRCGGLLEVQFRGDKMVLPQSHVSYLHRTVKDYLNKREIRETLKSWTGQADNTYEPSLAMLKAQTLQLKSINASGYNFVKVEDCLESAILYARRLESDTRTSQFELLEELFATGYSWARGHQAAAQILHSRSSSLTISINYGLHRYVGEKLRREKVLQGPCGKDLLEYAITHRGILSILVSAKVVSTLLEFGADLKKIQCKLIEALLKGFGEGEMEALPGADARFDYRAYYLRERAEIISCLLRAGVVLDAQTVVELRRKFGAKTQLLEDALGTVPAVASSRSRMGFRRFLKRIK